MRKFPVLLTLALACAFAAAQQQPDKGSWRAASNSAANITGDIGISASRLSINFTPFLIAPARALKPSEIAAVFDEAIDTAGAGQLYRLDIPAAHRFLSHNTLCGTEDVRWMGTYVAGKTLKVVFFSGDEAPVLTFEALQNSSDMCGAFTYVR